MLEINLFDMNRDEDFPFFFQSGHHDCNMPIHTHDCFSELTIITDGVATHVVGNEFFPVKKGDVFVINGSLAHGYINAEGLKLYNLMFTTEELMGMCRDLKRLSGFHSLFIVEPSMTASRGFKSFLKLSPDDFIPTTVLVENILAEYGAKNPGYQAYIAAKFTELVVLLSRLYEKSTVNCDDNIFTIAGAAAYLESHYSEPLLLPQLSKLSHYSMRHFMRLFESTYHTTPQRYLAAIRFHHAALLLKSTDLSVTEVATHCGFADSNYFSTAFKKEFGIPPQQYRKIK